VLLSYVSSCLQKQAWLELKHDVTANGVVMLPAAVCADFLGADAG
jgi:hypothetical protein